MTTHTSEYTVADTCIAIHLDSGDIIFADEILRMDKDSIVYLDRCPKKDWEGVPTMARNVKIDRITVGICPR